jgi:hypothetical protein
MNWKACIENRLCQCVIKRGFVMSVIWHGFVNAELCISASFRELSNDRQDAALTQVSRKYAAMSNPAVVIGSNGTLRLSFMVWGANASPLTGTGACWRRWSGRACRGDGSFRRSRHASC